VENIVYTLVALSCLAMVVAVVFGKEDLPLKEPLIEEHETFWHK